MYFFIRYIIYRYIYKKYHEILQKSINIWARQNIFQNFRKIHLTANINYREPNFPEYIFNFCHGWIFSLLIHPPPLFMKIILFIQMLDIFSRSGKFFTRFNLLVELSKAAIRRRSKSSSQNSVSDPYHFDLDPDPDPR